MHFEHDKKVKHLNTIRLSNIDSLNLNIVKYNKLFSIYVKDKYNTNNNLELQKTAMLKDSFSKNIAALGDSIKVERQKTMWQIFNGL